MINYLIVYYQFLHFLFRFYACCVKMNIMFFHLHARLKNENKNKLELK